MEKNKADPKSRAAHRTTVDKKLAAKAGSPNPRTSLRTADRHGAPQVHRVEPAAEASVPSRARRQNGKALCAGDADFRVLFDVVSVGIVQADPRNGQFIRYNEKYREITGYSDAELGAMKFPDLIHPDDRRRDWELFSRAARGKAPGYQNEKRYLRKDGSIIWVRVNASFIRDEAGKPVRTVAVCEDITDRKRAEEENLLSRKRLEEVLGSVSDGFFCLDHQMIVTHFNVAAEKLLNKKKKDILGRRLFDAFPEARGSVFEDEYTRALREKTPAAFQTYFGVKPYENWYEVRVYPSEEGLTVFFQVITGRKKSERRIEELNQSLQRRLSELETIFETVPVGIAIADDPEGRRIRGNPTNERLLGLHRGAEISKRAPDGLAPAYRALRDGREVTVDNLPMQRAVRGETVVGETLTVTRHDGSVVELLCNATPLLDEEGRPRGAVGSFQDITKRREAEEKLHYQAQLLDRLSDAVVSTDADFAIRSWNKAAERIYGWKAEEVIGRHVDEVLCTRFVNITREEASARLLADGVVELEIVHRNRHGEELFVQGNAALLRDAGGTVTGTLGVLRNVTARKRAEEALRRTAKRNELLSATAANLLQTDDPQGLIEKLCREVMEFIGCHVFFNYMEDEERLSLNACAGITEEDARKIRTLDYGAAVCGCVARDGERVVVEDILNTPDPRTEIVKSYGVQAYCCHPLKVADRVIGTLSFGTRTEPRFSDEQIEVMKTVTDLVAIAMHRIRTQKALSQGREDLDRAQAVGQIGWWRLDTVRNVLTWSDENHRIFGVSKGTPLSYESFLAVVHPDDRRYVDTKWKAGLRGEPYDLEHRIVAEGQVKWVREKAYLEFGEAGDLRGGFGITQDITARKLAEEALRKSEIDLRWAHGALQKANEELERRIAERTKELELANRDLERRTCDLNERVKELNCLYTVSHLLTERTTPLSKMLQEVVGLIPSGLQLPENTGARVVLGGLEVKTENFLDTPWKLQRPIRIQGDIQGMIDVACCEETPQRNGDPFLREEEALVETLAELIGDFMDRLRSRTQIEESEARYRRVSQQFNALLDAIPDMLLLISPDLKILWANKAALAWTGSEDLAGEPCGILWPGLAEKGDLCPARACFETGKLSTVRLGSLGSTICDVKAVPVKDETGTVRNVILIARDVTVELRLQEEALRSARLASLGELAAGVAHEINNPINSVINYAQILSNKAEHLSKEQEFAGEIVREGERIAAIVRGLLGFARDRRDGRYPLTFQNILEAAFVLSNAQLRQDGITLRTEAPGDLPLVQGNQQQLQQVLLNLISNARHALNEKYPRPHRDKILDITGQKHTIDGRLHLRIRVRDHGTGIPKGLRDKVTTPFFTTKSPSEGTGLGLGICCNIVADHGGILTLESVEGRCTSVTIDLPAEEPEEAP